jgi:major membrane immunogen (membrane-anchored lipoprotein)
MNIGMMNVFTSILILVSIFKLTCSTEENGHRWIDGIYSGSSQSTYIYEPYVGKTVIEIENQKIVKVEFQIVDTVKNEVFGPDYDKHFPDNVIYQEQCHRDWKGVQLYTAELLKTQDIDSIDAVSGATWSYNIFKASVKKAMNK